MAFITKKRIDDSTTGLFILGKCIIKKETLISSVRFFLVKQDNPFILKKYNGYCVDFYCLGKKIWRINKHPEVIIKNIFNLDRDYFYICFHSGDAYYLFKLIKENFEKYKNYKILSNFEYLKEVLYSLGFSKDWIASHFIKVDLFLPSVAFEVNSQGRIVNKLLLDHTDGWMLNGVRLATSKKFLNIKEVFESFIGQKIKRKELVNSPDLNRSSVILFPESQFNGNMSIEEVRSVIQELGCDKSIYTNSKTSDFQIFRSETVYVIYPDYAELLCLAKTCEKVIGIRSGVFDNLSCFFL